MKRGNTARQPGQWLRGKLDRRNRTIIVVAALLLGALIGQQLQLRAPGAAMIAILAAFWIFVAAALRVVFGGRWGSLGIERGLASEMSVGQAIEDAIRAPGCAVAHGVMETAITKEGDIDHLVATPAGLWVVETKTRRVPKQDFPKVLERLAANAAAVRRWAPRGVDVRACLAFAAGEAFGERSYREGGERIAAMDRKSLTAALRREARGSAAGNRDLARRVRELGRTGR